jgi:transposase
MKKIKTKKLKAVNPRMLIASFDASKDKHTGYFRFPDGTDMKPFDFRNDGRGFDEFWNRASKAMKAHNLEEIVVGFESTGPYAEPFVHYLRNRGARIVQVNPMHTKRLKELTGNSPSKTDYKDPKIIADIMGLGHALTVVVPDGVAADLRRLTQARERAMQRRTALINQLHGLVFLIFPEFQQVIKDIKSKTAQYLLKLHPTPKSIAESNLEELIHSLKKVSRGRFSKNKVEALYEAAKTSSGIKEGQKGILLEIREILASLETCQRFIGEIEKEMSASLNKIPYSSHILSIKGIGEITVAGVIGEVGDFNKFDTISEIEKLAGLDLFEISSGRHKGKRRITKRGRSLLRKLLYFGAINVVRKGGIFHGWYQDALKRGMPKMKALVAVSRKLLRIIFALVRKHSDFVSDYKKLCQKPVGNDLVANSMAA